MKKYQVVLICLIVLLGSTLAYGDYYIVNEENKVVGRTKYKPSKKDLDTRNEIAIYSKEVIDLKEIEYRAGKVVKHKKTSKELKAESDSQESVSELQMINKRVLHDACVALEADGFTFTHINCKDFE